jgi:heme oxygenase
VTIGELIIASDISPALAALREATRDLHATLDAASPLTAPGFTRTDYLGYAARVIGWMRPVERQLYATGLAWPEPVGADSRAQKSHWLAQDIGEAAQNAPECPYTPAPENLAGAYGLTYVCEGATLGGAYLYKRLLPQLAPLPLHWLRGYGADTGAQWKAFTASLAQEVTTPAQIEAAANAARQGFVTFERWMREGR